MKKFYLMVALAAALVSPVVAQATENKTEMVEYSGTLTMTNRRHAELNTADGTVYLMMHRLDSQIVPIKDGDQVTIKGYKVVPQNEQKKAEVGGFVVKVASIDANGKSYIIASNKQCNGNMGRGNMNHDGRGNMDAKMPMKPMANR